MLSIDPVQMACGCCTVIQVDVNQWYVACIPANSVLKDPHEVRAYHCKTTDCPAYQPRNRPVIGQDGKAIWPVCVCGEIAQAHE